MATCATVTVLGAATPTTCTSSCVIGSADVCINNNTYICMSGCLVATGVFCGTQPGGGGGATIGGIATGGGTTTGSGTSTTTSNSTSVLAPVCTEGSEVCSGSTLYTCANSTWQLVETDSPTCVGTPNTGTTTTTASPDTTMTYLVLAAVLIGAFVVLRKKG